MASVIAEKGKVVLGVKLVPTGAKDAIKLSARPATAVGTGAPVPAPVVTSPKKGVVTPAPVTTDVVLRFAIVLIDPTEDVDQDGGALKTTAENDQAALLKKKTETPVDFFKDLKKSLDKGEEAILGGGTYDVVASIPYQASGIKFGGTLSFRDLSDQKFDARMTIAVTSAEPEPFVVVLERELDRPVNPRPRAFGKEYQWLRYKLQDKGGNAMAGAKIDYVVDTPEEGYRRQRLEASSAATGRATWTIDGRNPTVIAVPEKRYIVLRADKTGYVARNHFTFPKSATPGTNESPNDVTIALWTPAEVGAALKTKNFYFDPGHAIAYAGTADQARAQEWYVCDRALQRTRTVLSGWGVPDANFFESRSAGLLYDEYYWKLDFGTKTAAPRLYTASINKARTKRRVDDLVKVLSLSTDALKKDFLARNQTTVDAEAKKSIGAKASAVRWDGDQLGADFDDGKGKKFVPLEVDDTVKLEFGKPSDNAIFDNLVDQVLADRTMDFCLRWDHHDGEITMRSIVAAANFDRTYIKERIKAQAKATWAFDWKSSASTSWLSNKHPKVRDAPQKAEAKRPDTAGEWNEVLLGWRAAGRQDHWKSLAPKFNGRDGLIVTLHLNADDDHSAARGSKAEYKVAAAKDWSKIMAKYVDPLEGGLRSKVGFTTPTSATFFDASGTDVFIEAEYQNSVAGNWLARVKVPQNDPSAKWLWLELNQANTVNRLGESIAEAIAEGFCYPQAEMSDW
jgi:hypothetical protein